jgi:hypothetical protein
MSFTKARERQQSEPEQANPNHGLMCRMPGCSLRWSVDIGRGRVCSFHDEQLSQRGVPNVGKRKASTAIGPIPVTAALPHWQDDSEAA